MRAWTSWGVSSTGGVQYVQVLFKEFGRHRAWYRPVHLDETAHFVSGPLNVHVVHTVCTFSSFVFFSSWPSWLSASAWSICAWCCFRASGSVGPRVEDVAVVIEWSGVMKYAVRNLSVLLVYRLCSQSL